MRWRGALELVMLDMCATALALGYALGRIGCQVSGDGDYGIRSSLPWAMGYPHGTVPTPPGVTVQPTPIYETVTMGLVAFLLWRLRDRVRPGVVFALYCLLSGLERFLVEFVRRNKEVLDRSHRGAAGECRADDRRGRVARADDARARPGRVAAGWAWSAGRLAAAGRGVRGCPGEACRARKPPNRAWVRAGSVRDVRYYILEMY